MLMSAKNKKAEVKAVPNEYPTKVTTEIVAIHNWSWVVGQTRGDLKWLIECVHYLYLIMLTIRNDTKDNMSLKEKADVKSGPDEGHNATVT